MFFFEECRKIPLWVDIYTELGGGNSNIFSFSPGPLFGEENHPF